MRGKALAFGALLVGVLAGCGAKTTLTIADVTLTVGQRQEVTYTLDPIGLFATTTLEVVSEEPDAIIEIDGMFLVALGAGTATVKGTATNMPGADKTFTATTNFDVTIEPIEAPEGEFILNGGFEFQLNEWTLTPDKTYETIVSGNVPHSGEYVLNLWLDDDQDTVGDALDATFSQEREVPAGTYLFSLWYQGAATSIAMSVKDGTTVLSEATFEGFGYKPVPENDGYVQLGIEVQTLVAKTMTFEIHVIGDVGFWGLIDDVSFRLGTLDDLEVAPANAETGYVNHITNGAFVNGEGWTVDITGTAVSKQANFTDGRLRIWANGVATLTISRSITITADTYSMCIYLNGGVFGSGEFNADAAHAYVANGLDRHELDIIPAGWGDGTLARVELSDLSLSGTIEVGIYLNFIGGTNNWVDIDDFTLWSYNQAV